MEFNSGIAAFSDASISSIRLSACPMISVSTKSALIATNTVSGDVWITHYITNSGRMGVSIVAETLQARSEQKAAQTIVKTA